MKSVRSVMEEAAKKKMVKQNAAYVEEQDR